MTLTLAGGWKLSWKQNLLASSSQCSLFNWWGWNIWCWGNLGWMSWYCFLVIFRESRDNDCSFTDCEKKKKYCGHVFGHLGTFLLQTWYNNRHWRIFHFDTCLHKLNVDSQFVRGWGGRGGVQERYNLCQSSHKVFKGFEWNFACCWDLLVCWITYPFYLIH